MSTDETDTALFAAVRAIVSATFPFWAAANGVHSEHEATGFEAGRALLRGVEISTADVHTLIEAFDLIVLALRPAATDTRH